MPSTTFRVPSISCQHCVRTIERELALVDGVRTVSADATAKTVTVAWDRPAAEDGLTAALTELGYQPAGKA